MKKYLSLFPYRHAFSAGLSVFIAVIVSDYVSWDQSFWIYLTAFLVNQTTRGTPFRQSILVFIFIIAATLFVYFLSTIIKDHPMIEIITIAVFIIWVYLVYLNLPLTNDNLIFYLCFPLVLWAVAFLGEQPMSSMSYVLDVMLGAMIGITVGQIVLPVNVPKEFNESLVPLMRALIQYSQALIEDISGHGDGKKIEAKKVNIEDILTGQTALYPEWVYETGFNPGLRSGYRFFLIQLEKIIESYFSMSYLLLHSSKIILINDVNKTLTMTIKKNQELLSILLDYFENRKRSKISSDFTTDMVELEKALQAHIPESIELLERKVKKVTINTGRK